MPCLLRLQQDQVSKPYNFHIINTYRPKSPNPHTLISASDIFASLAKGVLAFLTVATGAKAIYSLILEASCLLDEKAIKADEEKKKRETACEHQSQLISRFHSIK